MLLSAAFFLLALGQSAAQPESPSSRIYISEASRKPFERIVTLSPEKDSFRITAFCDGELPEKDLRVSFAIDKSKVQAFNSECGTSYKCVPEGSVKLSATTGIIPAGAVKAAPAEALLVRKKALKAGEKYLLPITVSSRDALVDESRGTIFYLLYATAPAGGTEAVRIGAVEPSFRDFLVMDGNLLIRWGYDDLKAYKINEKGLGAPRKMTIPANITRMEHLFPLGDDLLGAQCRTNSDGQLWAFPVDFQKDAVSDVSKIFGTSGYNIFSRIYPSGLDLYCLKDDAVMMLYSLDGDLEWTGVSTIGGSWDFGLIFPMGNSLYGVGSEGALWRFGIGAGGDVTIPRKAGLGWGKIVAAVPMGGFIIAADAEGNVWKIKASELIVL